LSFCHGSQAIVEQMASNYLLKSEVRNEVLDMMADPFFSLPDIVKVEEEVVLLNSGIVEYSSSSAWNISSANFYSRFQIKEN